ncbi:MAG: hypothetical protein Q6353_011160 [Candidatus Sigynarchaeum springense]
MSTSYMTFKPGDMHSSDAPVNWSPGILPSTLSYTLHKDVPGLGAGDDIVVSTALPVTQTTVSFGNMSVQPITVPVETYSEQYGGSNWVYGTLLFQELKVPASCYVQWLSLYIQYVNITSPITLLNRWNVSIYNATSSFPDMSPTPHEMIPGSSVAVDPRYATSGFEQYLGHWENITLGNVLLDSSKTLYHGGYYHFFVAVLLPPVFGHLWWFSNDTAGLADDYGKAYISMTFPYTDQRLSLDEAVGIDFTCITRLFPVSASPQPSDIGLTVNNEPVLDAGNGVGIYTTAEPLVPVGDIVTYNVESAWGRYPGGSFSGDASINYTVRDSIVPQVVANFYTSNSSVAWTSTYTFTQAKIKGQATATISIQVPNSWTSIALYNATGAIPVQIAGSTTPSPTGKYKTFTAIGITPGTWRLVARSAVLSPSITLNIASGTIDLSDSISGTASIVNGPNGRVVALRSDYEGGISSLSVLGGQANTTLTNAITGLDGKGIKFFNASGLDISYIYEKVAIGDFVEDFTLNNSMDLWVDFPRELRISDIQDIEIVFDHESFKDSWWWGNVTGAAMPENPSSQWILTPITSGGAFEKLLEVDLDPIVLNFTYNNSPGEKHYADVYFNYSLNVFDQLAIARDAITSMTFDVVTNFTASINHQVLFIKNQSSPTKDWVQMSSLVKQPALLWFLHEHWSSASEPAIQNITQFISPINNIVEMRIRTYNDTTIPVGPSVKHYFFVDQAVLNFTYSNTFKSFDMQVHNWTAGEYASTIMKFNPTAGKAQTVVHLGPAFANNFSGLIDPATGKVRVRIGAEATTPLVNTVWWAIDRIMLNLTYTSYVRSSWNQTVYNSAGGVSYESQRETLYDSPNNNFTVSIPVMSVLDYYDDYNYTMTWTNGTDIMYYQDDFSINRFSTILTLTSGIDGEYVVAGSVVRIQVQLTYGSNGSGVANQTVSVVIHLNTGGTVTFPGFTDAQGIASVGIRFDDGWDSFVYSVNYIPTDPRFRPSAVPASRSIPVYNDWEFMGYLLRSYWYIIVPAIAVILIGAIAKRGSDAKKKRMWKADADKIRDVVKIQHLMVIMKSSGACVVSRAYSQMQLDADLISGFLHAIATFGKEVGGDRGAQKKESGEAIVFDYQDFKILLQEGSQVRLALILNGPPTAGLKDRAKRFVTRFEATYDLQNWRGNLEIFNGVDTYIEEAFEITLIYPLVINPKKTKKDIKSGLGKALYEVGEAVQKEKQAFYLATLLTYAQAGRKESQDQVLGEIYQLKKQGFLTFYNPQVARST